MTRPNTPTRPAGHTTASELGTFTFCQRAWFLERQGQATSLTEERARGTADHSARVESIARGQRTARVARVLLILGLLALVCALLLAGLPR